MGRGDANYSGIPDIMKFTGEEKFEQAREEIWDRLTDMNFIANLIPDLERVEQIESDRFICRVRPQFAFLSGSLKLTFEIMEADPPDHLKVLCRGKGIGASVDVETDIRLRQESEVTILDWKGVIENRKGLLKPVSTGLIQGAAQKIIGDFWSKLRSALDADSDSPSQA